MSVIRCLSPVDGRLVAERPAVGAETAAAALARARQAQADWAARPLDERIAAVEAGIAALCAQAEEATPELAWQMGRPVRYGGEFGGVSERAGHMAAIAGQALSDIVAEDSARFGRRIRWVPHGVVLVIAPWNYPYMTAINAVVPALIAGNAVLVKPAAQTLLSGERLVAALRAGGVPEAVVQVQHMSRAATLEVIAAGQVDFVNFTGSTAAGREIEAAAAGTFTPMGLELGGKDPAYVMADADIGAAAAGIVDAAFFNSGQCCCGIERAYVAAPVFDAFMDAVLAEARGLVLGDPLDPATTLGPMARPDLAAGVRAQIEEARALGAVTHLPRDPADDGKGYLGAQVLTGVDHAMALMRAENFGPVLGIMPVESDAEAVALMNDSPYGLTASLWSADPGRAERLAGRIETGTVFLNRADYLDPALCWTGCKGSGRGAALSELGYHALTRPQSLHFRRRS